MDQPASIRLVVVVALISALVGAGGGMALSAAVVKQGPRGVAGTAGRTGARGPVGPGIENFEEHIYNAIEASPKRVADALRLEMLKPLCREFFLSHDQALGAAALHGCP